jgi:hypothetical protein
MLAILLLGFVRSAACDGGGAIIGMAMLSLVIVQPQCYSPKKHTRAYYDLQVKTGVIRSVFGRVGCAQQYPGLRPGLPESG